MRGCCIGVIMMSSEANAFQQGTRSPDEFRRLLRRHLVLVSQLGLASKDFGDLSGLPKEHVAAALVVQEANAELQVLHDKLHEWYVRQNSASNVLAMSATETAAAGSTAVSLVLKEYAPDRKVNVIRVLREIVPGCSLTTAKALVERELPTHIADGLAPEAAIAMRQKFEAVGAVCIISAR
jgi:large subunit ribosomal protein L7/L12